MKRVNKLTLAAMLTALAVVLVWLASVMPRGGLALVAVAGIVLAAVVMECGLLWAALHYAAVSILALLLVPVKTMALWYVFVLGHYGIFKALIERIRVVWLQWVCKLALFAAAVVLFYRLFAAAFAAALPAAGIGVLMPVLAVVFVVYDLAFSRLIGFYEHRIRRAMH